MPTTKTIYVRDADSELWRKAEARAQKQGASLSELLTEAVSGHLDRVSAAKDDDNGEADAPHGEKMLVLNVRLFTNNIAKGTGKILPKHAWAAGVVTIRPNDAHGIKAEEQELFHTLLDLPVAIEKLLVKAGIVLHVGERMRRYLR